MTILVVVIAGVLNIAATLGAAWWTTRAQREDSWRRDIIDSLLVYESCARQYEDASLSLATLGRKSATEHEGIEKGYRMAKAELEAATVRLRVTVKDSAFERALEEAEVALIESDMGPLDASKDASLSGDESAFSKVFAQYVTRRGKYRAALNTVIAEGKRAVERALP